MSRVFWKKWVEADELERVKLVKTMPIFKKGNTFKYMNAVLLNSYLVDLYEHIQDLNKDE